MEIKTAYPKPESSFACLALVKTQSSLAKRWKLDKPGYCIYEYDKVFDEHQIRWGDTTWENLSEEDLTAVVLLEQFDKTTFDQIIGHKMENVSK